MKKLIAMALVAIMALTSAPAQVQAQSSTSTDQEPCFNFLCRGNSRLILAERTQPFLVIDTFLQNHFSYNRLWVTFYDGQVYISPISFLFTALDITHFQPPLRSYGTMPCRPAVITFSNGRQLEEMPAHRNVIHSDYYILGYPLDVMVYALGGTMEVDMEANIIRVFTPRYETEEFQAYIARFPNLCPLRTNEEEFLRAIEQETFRLINEHRTEQGWQPLTWCEGTAAAARLHSMEVAQGLTTGHIGSDGSTVPERGLRQGASVWAENVMLRSFYAGGGVREIAASTFRGWMGSPGHNRVMLIPFATHGAVGIATGERGIVSTLKNGGGNIELPRSSW